MSNLELFKHIDKKEMAHQLAAEIVEMAKGAVAENGVFSLFLSGGSSPRLLHQTLASEPFISEMPWSKVHLFWGDERKVPKEHKDSNFGLAYQDLVSKVPIPTDNVHPMVCEIGGCEEWAEAYDELLKSFLLQNDHFDLIVLGIGTDGHTASLFPGTPALEETDGLVTVGQAPASATTRARVTLTYTAFTKAKSVYFVVAGDNKAHIIEQITRLGEEAPYPAARVRASESVQFHLDGATVTI